MFDTTEEILSGLLDGAAEDLDITPALHDAAQEQYHNVGQFLADQSDFGVTEWDVYPQGSFRLGTVVRPIGKDHYDLDMVCRLDMAVSSITRDRLKERVGQVLQSYVKHVSGQPGAPTDLEPSRRCWALKYPGAFHLDVLPALPNENDVPNGIRLTDTNLVQWQFSNPIDFADWFRLQSEVEYQRKAAALEARKDIEPFPRTEVKTTLQRVAQVLKRHRDIYFDGDPERPPSILITTLAAFAYTDEQDLFAAVRETASTMTEFIENVNGQWFIKNPVADENFADKWNDHPERKDKFFRWRDQLETDLDEAARGGGIDVVTDSLSRSLGDPIRKAAGMLGDSYRQAREQGGLKATSAGLLGTAAGESVRSHGFFGSSSGQA